MDAPPGNKRITVSSILNEAWHSITHVENGLRKTIVALAVDPGKMLQNYLSGDRKSYQRPFSFLLISTALFALVLHLLHPYYQIPSPKTFNDRLFNNQLLLKKFRNLIQVKFHDINADNLHTTICFLTLRNNSSPV